MWYVCLHQSKVSKFILLLLKIISGCSGLIEVLVVSYSPLTLFFCVLLLLSVMESIIELIEQGKAPWVQRNKELKDFVKQQQDILREERAAKTPVRKRTIRITE